MNLPGEWINSGICAQTSPDEFFPEKGGSTREAKAICNGRPERGIPPCPVKAACAEWALATDERFGIWGGMSEKDRRVIRRERRAAA